MKNSLKIALALTTLIGGLSVANAEKGGMQSAQEARERLLGVSKAMREHGATWTASILNGHQAGGTSSSRKGDTAESEENQQFAMGDDSEAGIICVTNSDGEWKYSVHQLRPMLVGKSAVSGQYIWRDGVGIAMVDKILAEMKAQNSHKVTITYVDTTPGVNEGRQGKPEEVTKQLLAVDKHWLLEENRMHNQHGPNVPGEVICATTYFQAGATDEGDFNRLTAPDMPSKVKPAVHKAHHAKKATPAAAKAEEHKDGAKKEEHKDAAKKEEPKKEEAKKAEGK